MIDIHIIFYVSVTFALTHFNHILLHFINGARLLLKSVAVMLHLDTRPGR